MRLLILIFILFTPGVQVFYSQTGSGQSGTITIEKEKISITGLYHKTNVLSGSMSDVIGKMDNDKKSGAVKSDTYFFFLSDGRLYQINSDLSSSKILKLAEDDPVKLRPVLASYAIQDSTIIITPMQESIKDAMEPVKAYYEGGLVGTRLFLTKRSMAEIFVFEKIEN